MKKNMKTVSDDDFARMQRVNSSRNKYVKGGFYYSYGLRIVAMIVTIIIIAIAAFKCFDSSFSDGKDVILTFNETSDIKYDVQVFEDNFFGTGDLVPLDTYISEVIDNISTDIFYNYKLDKKADVKYNYNIVAIMELKGTDGDIVSRTKYKLVDKVEDLIRNTNEINIEQNINLDYDYYNDLAKAIKEQMKNVYNMEILGNLTLKMDIELETNYSNFVKSHKHSQSVEVNIPLMSTKVKAELMDKLDNRDAYIEHTDGKLGNKYTLYFGVLLLIIDTILVLLACGFVFRSTPKKSKYCLLRDGLVKDYDELIVNSKNLPDLDKYNVVDCYSFNELLDAQNLLNRPIIFYEVVKDQKSVFVIISGNDAYRFVLKECDIEF